MNFQIFPNIPNIYYEFPEYIKFLQLYLLLSVNFESTFFRLDKILIKNVCNYNSTIFK